ncbi:MAG: hypothetical protein HKN51_02680 [Saprospiraceae bacterium]|nr:hypothetical protein [Saprospiraceae bacterium]
MFSTTICAQIEGYSECLDDGDAFIGLDRKGWTTQVDDLSESYQFDFEIPDQPPLECHGVAYIEVDILFDNTLFNIDPACFLGFWTHAFIGCDNNDPLGCPTSTLIYDESGLNQSLTFVEDFENGDILGVDVVVVIDPSNPACTQTPISDGDYVADVEVCITIFYEPLEPEMEVDLGDDIIVCNNDPIELEGPDGFEEYEWDGPVDSDEQNLQNAIPGVYTLDAYDALGCKSSDEIEIIFSNDIDVAFNQPPVVNICAQSEEMIVSIIDGIENNSDYDYNWTFPLGGSSNNSQIDITEFGTYVLVVTDENDCTASSSVTVNEIEISFAQIDSLSSDTINICIDQDTSVTAFVPFDDFNNYAFEWIIGIDTIRTQEIMISQAGTYILNMNNLVGCPPSSDTLIVTETTPNSAGEGTTRSICIGEVIDLNELLSLNASAGGMWFDNTGTIIPDGMYEGTMSGVENITYQIDNNLPCPDDSVSFSIFTNDSNVNAGDDMNNNLCQNETIDLGTLVNGDAGGQFFDNTFTLISNPNLVGSVLGEGSFIYYYIIESNTCGRDTATYEIQVAAEILPTIINGPLCPTESTTIDGVVYDINNPSGMTVFQSVNSCDSIIEIDLSFYALADTSITDTYCSSDVAIIGGQSFDVNNPNGDIIMPNMSINGCDSIINVALNFIDASVFDFGEELCEGQNVEIEGEIFDESNATGTVTITNGSILGCDSIINVSLTFSSAIMENINPELCTGDSIDINGTIYNNINPSGQQTTVDADGCQTILNIDVVFLNDTDSLLSMSICENETIDINGEIFDQSNIQGSQSFTNSIGCDSTLNIEIEIIPSSINMISDELCQDDLEIINGETFSINNPSGTVIIPNGSYLSCDSIIEVAFTFIPTETSSQNIDLCVGDSILINNTWINSNGTISDTLISSIGCDSIVETTVMLTSCNITIDFDQTEPLLCYGDGALVEFVINGAIDFPYEYELYDADVDTIVITNEIDSETLVITNLGALNYYLILYNKSDGSIASELNFSISEPSQLEATVTPTEIDCASNNTGSLSINASGGTEPYDYLWSTGETSSIINNLMSGNYSYTVMDDNGCEIFGNLSLIDPDAIDAIIAVTNSECEAAANGSIEIMDVSGGSPVYTYSLDGYTYTQDNVFSDLSAGLYQVFISDDNGCIEVFDATIENESFNEITPISNIFIEQGDSITVVVSSNFNPTIVLWSPETSIDCTSCISPNFNPLTTTTYTVMLTDEFGCTISTDFTINVRAKEESIFVPTVFNPNDAVGGNDIFKPLFEQNSTMEIQQFSIYDRWGNLVHSESGNEITGWDGYSNNKKSEQGIYIYIFIYNVNGIQQEMIGDITLLR